MHQDSVMRMLGYCERFFENGKEPIAPWSLHLNFNHTHKTIELRAHHFGEYGATPELMQAIETIDPGWSVQGAEPIFEESATKRRLNISDVKNGHIDLQAMLDNIGKPREATFFSVMRMVFGKG